MEMGDHIYTTGFIAGRIFDAIFVLFLIGGIGFGLWFKRRPEKGPYDGVIPWSHKASGNAWIIICALLLLITPILYFPWDMDYHARVPVTGEVERVDSRILSEGGDLSEKMVITFTGSNTQFGCKDTRCASLREGDRVQLLCTKNYDWNSADGWNCGWGWSEQQ